jgi:hypothetical protein
LKIFVSLLLLCFACAAHDVEVGCISVPDVFHLPPDRADHPHLFCAALRKQAVRKLLTELDQEGGDVHGEAARFMQRAGQDFMTVIEYISPQVSSPPLRICVTCPQFNCQGEMAGSIACGDQLKMKRLSMNTAPTRAATAAAAAVPCLSIDARPRAT